MNKGTEIVNFKFLPWITILVITFQLISDVTAGKIIDIWGYSVSITVIYFPITYLLGDILTEVYGYERARSVIWKSLIASIIAGIVYQIVAYFPPADQFTKDQSYKDVFTIVPLVLIGGWLAVFAGEIANNYILSKMKIATKGRYFGVRAVASTFVGQFLNTSVFYIIALSSILPANILFQGIIAGWLLKTAVEIVLLPLTYAACSFLKRAEGIDAFDNHADYNPFRFGR